MILCSKVKWPSDLTVTATETTAARPAAANVNPAGGEPTAPNWTAPGPARIGAAALTERANASKASGEKTARPRPVLWNAEPTAGASLGPASVPKASSAGTAPKASA